MSKKKVRKIIGFALAAALLGNSITYYAVPKAGGESYSNLIESVKGDVAFKPNNSSDTMKVSDEIDTTSEEVVSVIVEFVSEPLAVLNKESKAIEFGESKVDRDHRLFEEFLGNLPSTYSTGVVEVEHSYRTVFNGVSLNIKGTEVEKLLNSPVVKRVHNNNEVQVDKPVQEKAKTVDNVNIEPYMMDSVPFLNVDELHKENIKGDGIKVGVLDTGIDYNHPDLTSAYRGFRAQDGDPTNQDINNVKGWDFVGKDADPMETTYEDWKNSGQPEHNSNGSSYYTSHGTHVSGTIAGQQENTDTDYPVLGVAPNVELYGYRVLGQYGSGSTANIIAAIEKSVLDGMDVINMSLGNSGVNHPFDPMVAAVNNATLAGVVTVIANGNSGPTAQTVGAPGTAPLPIAVGASTVDFDYNRFNVSLGEDTLNGEQMVKDIKSSIDNLVGQELELVHCGLGKEEDFEGKDLTGKVAIVDRGEIALVNKIQNATKNGAALTIMVNNTPEGRVPYLGELDMNNTISLSLADGEVLKANLDKTISISPNGTITVEGDEVTGFSSVGPVKDTFDIRPDVVAPGSQVFSTVPEYINDKNEDVDNYGIAYQRSSGTSMAAPHVAGVAALILQENPDYTPADVKAALMNTSEHIHQKSGESYSVHETGAGRINPYEAVHEGVNFKANYKVVAGDMQEELDNETGMLSYGRFVAPEEEAESKTIPVTIENNTDVAKTYTVEVEYSDSNRAADAEKNNVTVSVPETVTVEGGSVVDFDATINLPVGIDHGNYEGFIHFVEVGNESNDYQMPFSATIKKTGIESVDYPIFDGLPLKGLTAFTTSQISEKNPHTVNSFTDIAFIITVNEPIEYIHTFVKDKESGEYIGYAGSEEGWWIPEGKAASIERIVPNGRVRKIFGDKISHEEIALEQGIYDLEIVVEAKSGKTYSKDLPMGIENSIDRNEVTFNMPEGIIEVTEDMFTKETWYDGNSREGIWLKATAKNKLVEEMKNYGLSYLKQEEINGIFAEGYYPNGQSTVMYTMPQQDGKIMLSGVERSDLEDGFFNVEINYQNVGKLASRPYNFTFVKPETKYLSIELHDEKVSGESILRTSITLNNSEDITQGSFELENYGNATLQIDSITPSAELQALLAENNNDIEINYEVSKERLVENFNISFNITGDEVVGLNGDVKLFDIVYSIEDFKGVDKDIRSPGSFVYNKLRGKDGEFRNSSNEVVDVKAETIRDSFEVENKNRTIIFGQTSQNIRGMIGGKVYAVDEKGNRYEPTYMKDDEMLKLGVLFTFNDLPVIEGDYKIVAETPGALNSVMYVPGSKVNSDGELVGNVFEINSTAFLTPSWTVYMGDVNGDGAIDVRDANEVGKVYKAEIPTSKSLDLITDLNNDGVVNRWDMETVLFSLNMKDYSREDAADPVDTVDGKDIIDILEECGYYDEVPELNVELGVDKVESVVGDELTFEAVPPVSGLPFEYEFSVREAGTTEWNVIQERSQSDSVKWISENHGEYEVKVRIFLDDAMANGSDYVSQDVKNISVKAISYNKVSNVKAIDKGSNEVTLAWNSPVDASGLEGYVIYKDGRKIAELGAEELQYTVNNLRSNTIYGFKVTAKYKDGKESKPTSLNIRTTK